MRIKKKDSEEFRPDKTSVAREYPLEDSEFSISVLEIDGTHEVDPEKDTAYFVLEGDGHVHLEGNIKQLEVEDVVYTGQKEHVLEGDLKVLRLQTE